jgi:hypothetical protein
MSYGRSTANGPHVPGSVRDVGVETLGVGAAKVGALPTEPTSRRCGRRPTVSQVSAAGRWAGYVTHATPLSGPGGRRTASRLAAGGRLHPVKPS